MVDFKKLLTEQRLKKKMAAAVPAPEAISMVPQARAKKEPEVLPDLRELDFEPADRLHILRLVNEAAALGIQERVAKASKKNLVPRIKKFLEGPIKFMVDGNRVNYYNGKRTTISKELLLSHNVSPAVIAACTITKDNWTLRITPAGFEDEEQEYE